MFADNYTDAALSSIVLPDEDPDRIETLREVESVLENCLICRLHD